MKIRIGTRKSQLALWQTNWVAERLIQAGAEVEIVKMETIGDKVLDTSIAKIGSKGVFTQELEEKITTGEVDIAVHSAKDLQSVLPPQFEIIAFSSREISADVIVGTDPNILDKPGSVIGTSSTRRKAVFKKYFPHLKIKEIRGNLNTRFQKLDAKEYDAIALAYAGVKRLGLEDRIAATLDPEIFVPAVGQGCIAIEASRDLDDDKKEFLRSAVNDDLSEKLLIAERTYLSEMNGGCSIPIFASCMLKNGQLELTGGIIDLDGSREIKLSVQGTDPISTGRDLFSEVKKKGGLEILKDIRKQLDDEAN